MEMEEGHDQPKIAPAPKRMKFQEIMEKGEEDRISVLPDCLLLEILSRLPSTKEAIRTGTLSKRWEHLWTWVPTLIFHDDDLKFTWADFVSFVDKTLTQCRQLKLKKFEVFTPGCVGFESQVNNWIHYAIRCNVEKLCLVLWGKDDDEFPLDQSFSINTCVTDLTLSCCKLDPIGVISWKSLRSLCILYGNLEEDLIKNILSGSPLLETLVLDKCYVYWRLDIISKSVKNLVLNNCHGCGQLDFDFVEIKAPNITSLKIKGERFLWNFLFVNLSSLVEANLDYTNTTPTKAEEEKLKRFIINLRHVKELKIGVSCSEVLSRLEAEGFVFPSNMKLPNAS